ncbi:MAG: transcription termination factor Rho [Nocardioides sp.]
MTETIESSTPSESASSTGSAGASESTGKKRGGGLNSMLIADLKSMAGSMGISGAGSMKKAQLVEAIKTAQSSARSGAQTAKSQNPKTQNPKAETAKTETPKAETAKTQAAEKPDTASQAPQSDTTSAPKVRSRTRNTARTEPTTTPESAPDSAPADRAERRRTRDQGDRDQADRDQGNRENRDQSDRDQGNREQSNRDQGDRQGNRDQGDRTRDRDRDNDRNRDGDQDRDGQGGRNRNQDTRQDNRQDNQGGQNQGGQSQGGQQNRARDNDPDGQGGSRSSRRRRGRDRGDRNERDTRPERSDRSDRSDRNDRNDRRGNRNEPDTTILEDDVLVPAAGILDVLDNYAFVRTSGYLPGTEDVYVSLSMVRRFGLRRGDAIVGQVRQPREGERKEKFNPMVRIDSVNGADPDSAKNRVDFAKLTPLYASERLRLETEPTNLIGRVIDIAAPIGKGQRGLIVSPSKAGKTMIMQSIANSITTNNPECHLMVVLVDERPEEVTDFERSVKGEVISSTFDRPATDHTTVAELAIERAKRLVELGHDVVVLLDGITRLGRAYNLAAPASGRILSGGVDSAALYPPKRFFGAARNIENGGSLTILATALIESGSKMDEVIFEEFKGTGNMEIRLRRDFADKRIFPAIDAVQSGTRREELLMSKEELAIVWKLRRVLSGLDGQQALELLLERLKKSQSNIEFLMQVQKTTPGGSSNRDDD